jgi:hypothetical protein
MSCVTACIDDIYLVQWIVPAIEDVDRIVAECVEIRKKTGRRLDYIAIIPVDCDRPPDAVRKRMSDSIDSLLDTCETVHLVVEGTGFRRAVLLSIAIGVFLTSKNRARTFTHGSLRDALKRLGRGKPQEIQRFVDQASAVGFAHRPTGSAPT